MQTGDTVSGDDRSWTLGEQLGTGVWATTWEAFDPSGSRWVARIPRRSDSLPGDAPRPDGLDDLFARAASEQMQATRQAGLRIEAVLGLPEGRLGMILPRYETLADRIRSGGKLREVLGLLVQLAESISTGPAHGNLRPSNILIDERGTPHASDRCTPALAELLPIVEPTLRGRRPYDPPEGARGSDRDAWAICQMLYEATLAGGERSTVDAPERGLDKVALASVRDHAVAQLSAGGANRRFAPRFADRLAALLNRGLAEPAEPSPPYRFRRMEELRERLAEVAALARPRITDVGRVILASDARQGVFQGGAPVRFSVSVHATHGVGMEDVVCGVKLVDLDAEEQGRVHVEDVQVGARPHPSGRLRFDFQLPEVPPGRYEATVAIGIKDGGRAPTTATGRMEVRPPPGWVPPAAEPPPEADALRFPTEQVVATEPFSDAGEVATGAVTDVDPSSGADEPSTSGPSPVVPLDGPSHEPEEAVQPAGFPTPLAPSSPGVAPPATSREPQDIQGPGEIGASIESDDAGLPAPGSSSDQEVLSGSPTLPQGESVPPTLPSSDPLQLTPSMNDVPTPGPFTRHGAPGADLPSFEEELPSDARSLSRRMNDFIETVRSDPYTALMGVIVIALTVLLIAILSARACAA